MPADNTNKKAQPNLSSWIENEVEEFCRNSLENSLRNKNNDPLTDDPIVGFSNGADPLYDFLQKDIGTPQMTPIQIFQTAFPNTQIVPDELTIISYILPKTRRFPFSLKTQCGLSIRANWKGKNGSL